MFVFRIGSVLGALVVCLLCSAVSFAQSQQNAQVVEKQAQPKQEKPFAFRGSSLTLRNYVSATTFDSSYQTYNPTVSTSLDLNGIYWFNKTFYTQARLGIIREWTESDTNTYQNETLLDNLTLKGSAYKIVTIPWVGIDVTADLELELPTSKISQARTLIMDIKPGLTLFRNFDVLAGLRLTYSARGGAALHSYTTSKRKTPLIQTCSFSSPGCDAFLNTGLRNSAGHLSQLFSVNLSVTDDFSANLVYGQRIDWLYSISEAQAEKISLETPQAQNNRYTSFFVFELGYLVMDSLEIVAGYQTISPQLAPDSTYYNPLYNPYTTLYFDLRLDAQGLYSQLTGRDVERSDRHEF